MSSFAFVPSKSQLEIATEGIGILLGWRLRGAYEAKSIVVDHLGVESTFEIWVNTFDGSYRAANLETGDWESFNAANGLRRYSNQPAEPLSPNALFFQPEAVRLSFPLSLPIWNQYPDDYRISGAIPKDDVLTLLLTNVRIPWLEGTLEINLGTRDVTRITTPSFSYRYEEVSPSSESIADSLS